MLIRPVYRPRMPSLAMGLTGWWTFDGKDTSPTMAFDRSGLGNHGTLNGSPKLAGGIIHEALKFDGSTSYISGGFSLARSQTSLTVSVWINPSSATDFTTVYFEPVINGGSGRGRVFIFVMGNRTIEFGGRGSAAEPTGAVSGIRTTGTIPLNRWSHVVGVWNGGTGAISVFFNAASQAGSNLLGGGTASAFATTAPDAAFPGRIGNDSSGDPLFSGLIDDVRVYNRALSPAEILALYAEAFQPQIDVETIALMQKSQQSFLAAWAMGRNQISQGWAS